MKIVVAMIEGLDGIIGCYQNIKNVIQFKNGIQKKYKKITRSTYQIATNKTK